MASMDKIGCCTTWSGRKRPHSSTEAADSGLRSGGSGVQRHLDGIR